MHASAEAPAGAAPPASEPLLQSPQSEAAVPKPTQEEEVDDIGETLPSYYYDNGTVPVFEPTMSQFRDFRKFVEKIDHYGMKTGIVKVIPPAEWKASLPDISDKLKQVKIHRPIAQEFEGSRGIFRQMNVERKRTYTMDQWKRTSLSLGSKTPERRRNRDPIGSEPSNGRSSRAERAALRAARANSPAKATKPTLDKKERGDEAESENEAEAEDTKTPGAELKLPALDEFTDERCKELEETYWRTVTYGAPMYGADMLGSLFDDRTTSWNVSKLENVLDELGTKVPGVNTAYLYVGMWKATFAWHVEDVDLYSINYIHTGAPKQWYSISQDDTGRFEAAMSKIWPEAKRECDQFLRHKTFLVSPERLKKEFDIQVNRLVHREGEFVITFPHGYHAGYNIGYNCAESVNFATRSWIEKGVGRRAKKCECIGDSVWVNVREIEQKLGIHAEGFTDDEEESEDSEESEMSDSDVDPAARLYISNGRGRSARAGRGRSRGIPRSSRKKPGKSDAKNCIFCPTTDTAFERVPALNHRVAHKLCSDVFEPYWRRRQVPMSPPDTPDSQKPAEAEEDSNAAQLPSASPLPPAFHDSKCSLCKSKRGFKLKCAEKKCNRTFHPTCLVICGGDWSLGSDLVALDDHKWKVTIPQFSCWTHRKASARPADEKNQPDVKPEECAPPKTHDFGDIVQVRVRDAAPWAGVVVENRSSEGIVLLRPLTARRKNQKASSPAVAPPTPANPSQEKVEIESRWILNPTNDSIFTTDATLDGVMDLPDAKWKEYIALAEKEYLASIATSPTEKISSQPGGLHSGTLFLLPEERSGSLPDENADQTPLTWGELIVGEHVKAPIPQTPQPADFQVWHYLPAHSTDARDEYGRTASGPPDKAAKVRVSLGGPELKRERTTEYRYQPRVKLDHHRPHPSFTPGPPQMSSLGQILNPAMPAVTSLAANRVPIPTSGATAHTTHTGSDPRMDSLFPRVAALQGRQQTGGPLPSYQWSDRQLPHHGGLVPLPQSRPLVPLAPQGSPASSFQFSSYPAGQRHPPPPIQPVGQPRTTYAPTTRPQSSASAMAGEALAYQQHQQQQQHSNPPQQTQYQYQPYQPQHLAQRPPPQQHNNSNNFPAPSQQKQHHHPSVPFWPYPETGSRLAQHPPRPQNLIQPSSSAQAQPAGPAPAPRPLLSVLDQNANSGAPTPPSSFYHYPPNPVATAIAKQDPVRAGPGGPAHPQNMSETN